MGSSRNRTAGSTATARAMLTRWASPPDRRPAPPGEVADLEELEGGVGTTSQIVAPDPATAQAAFDVAAHRCRQKVSLLKDGRRASPQPQPVAAAAHRPTLEEQLATGPLEAVEGAQQGGLAGAVGSQQHVDLTGVERQVRHPHGYAAAAADRQVACFEEVLGQRQEYLDGRRRGSGDIGRRSRVAG